MPVRKTMNVSITPELGRSEAERVASGHYSSASEVVRAALRLLEKAEREERLSERPPHAQSGSHAR